MADLSCFLGNRTSSANPEFSGSISKWKKAPFVSSCRTTRDQSPKMSINLVPGWGHFTPFLHVKKWKCCTTGTLNELHRTADIWRLSFSVLSFVISFLWSPTSFSHHSCQIQSPVTNLVWKLCFIYNPSGLFLTVYRRENQLMFAYWERPSVAHWPHF